VIEFRIIEDIWTAPVHEKQADRVLNSERRLTIVGELRAGCKAHLAGDGNSLTAWLDHVE